MRIDPHKKVRDVAGEHIVIMQDAGEADMTRVVAFNESALWLYRQLKDKDFTTEDATRLLLDEYEVDEATAARDAAEWVEALKREGIATDE